MMQTTLYFPQSIAGVHESRLPKVWVPVSVVRKNSNRPVSTLSMRVQKTGVYYPARPDRRTAKGRALRCTPAKRRHPSEDGAGGPC